MLCINSKLDKKLLFRQLRQVTQSFSFSTQGAGLQQPKIYVSFVRTTSNRGNEGSKATRLCYSCKVSKLEVVALCGDCMAFLAEQRVLVLCVSFVTSKIEFSNSPILKHKVLQNINNTYIIQDRTALVVNKTFAFS